MARFSRRSVAVGAIPPRQVDLELPENKLRVVQDKSHAQFEAQGLIPVQRVALRSTDRLIWLTLLRIIELPQC